MKKHILIPILLVAFNLNLIGQEPDWSVEENQYQYTMTLVSFLSVNGNVLSSSSDKLAAFANGECRGVTTLSHVQSEDQYFAYLSIFANNNQEEISFKIYDASNDLVVDIEKTITFEIGSHLGTLLQPLSLAIPPLSNEADLLDFNLKNVQINKKENVGNEYFFGVNQYEDITQLVPEFEVSNGAMVYVNSVPQTSGISEINFTEAPHYFILSEDRSILNEWIVHVEKCNGTATFYKKDAVCYAGGAIKIDYTVEGVDVILKLQNNIIATKRIIGGEALFEGLFEGDYSVEFDGIVKQIPINLKQ